MAAFEPKPITSGPVDLGDAFDALKPALEQFTVHGRNWNELPSAGSGLTVEAKEFIRTAQNLVRACKDVRNSLYNTAMDQADVASKKLNLDCLKERVIPYHQVRLVVEMLTDEKIQKIHLIKKELSAASRFLIELAAFQCLTQGEPLEKPSVDSIISNITRTLKPIKPSQTKPNRPVSETEAKLVTQFELKCCLAAAKKFEVDEGTKKVFLKKHGAGLSMAVVQTLLTANAAPPFVSLAPLVEPVADLIKDLYAILEEPWYQTVWLLRWHSADEKIKRLEELAGIREELDKYKENNMVAFYVSQLFKAIIDQEGVSAELRESLIAGEDISLVQLAKYNPQLRLVTTRFKVPIPRWEDTFWETRYQSLNHLHAIIKAQPDNTHRIEKIAEAALNRIFGGDENALVLEMATSLLVEIGRTNPAIAEEQCRKFIPIDKVMQEVQEDPEEKFVAEFRDAEQTIVQGLELLNGEFAVNDSTGGPDSFVEEIEEIKATVKEASEFKAERIALFKARARALSLMSQGILTKDWNALPI